MEVHHFKKSLKREGEAAQYADTFYKQHPFSVIEIERYNQGTEDHMIRQRQDIDVQLSFPKNRNYTVSEKFREHDYNDLLLEIYSKYPSTKGWMYNSKADRLAYFFPTRMFWIDKEALSQFCLNVLFPHVEHTVIDELLKQEQNSLKVGLNLKGKIYSCTLTQAFNNTDGDTWNTISISVPFKMLKDFDIRYQEFPI